jgi:hypothetical protein
MSGLKKGKYRHYKGNLYEVIGEARHSETEEVFVLYRPLYGEKQIGEHSYWVRPIEMFTENVLVDGKLQPRFALMEAN